MMEIFVTQFQIFLLILARISGIFIDTPFFGNINVPFEVRGGLALFISLVIFPGLVDNLGVEIPSSMVAYGLLLIQEFLIGMFIGFAVSIMFSLFQLTGEFYSLQMGLGIINVLDPLAQIELPIIGQLLSLFGILIFFLVGGHHLVIMAVYKSYELVPSLTLTSFEPMAIGLVDIFVRMFTIACMLALPIIGVLFLCSVAMGILSRAAPQMNIMMLGWPVNIFVGMATLIILIPMFYGAGQNIFEELFTSIDKILYSISRR